MTYALVGTPAHISSASAATTQSLTYSPTAGNGLVLIYAYQNANAINVTAIKNQSAVALPFTLMAARYDGPSEGGIQAFWLPNMPSGVTAIVITTDTSAKIGMEVIEYSGLWTTNAAAGTASAQATATTATDNVSVAITPTQQPGMLFAVSTNITRTASPNAGTGFTGRTNTTYALTFGNQILRTEDKRITSTSATNATFTNVSTSGDTFQTIAFVIPEPPPAPTLSLPTPSGTLATSSTATPGATTDTGSGTGYCVVTTSSLTGVTAAQVKAGQNAAGSTVGVFNSNGAISATGAFTCPTVTGLSASTLYNYAVVQNSTGGDSNVVTGTFTTHAPVPTISGVAPNPILHLTSATISGTTFGSTKGTGNALIAGVNQTTTAWADTSVTMTVDRGANAYGVSVNVTITNNNGDTSAGFGTTISPQSGWQYINIGTPNTTATNRLTTTGGGDLASGDQATWGNITGTGAVTVFSDGTFVADSTVVSFDYTVWTTGSGWGSTATETLIVAATPQPACIIIS